MRPGKVAISKYFRLPLIPLLGSFGAGLLAGDYFCLFRGISVFIVALGAGWLIYAILRQKSAWPVALTGFFGAGWLAMTGFTCPDLPSHHVSHFTGDTRWIITGTIMGDPVPKPGHQHFFLKTARLGNQAADFAATGNLRVKIYGQGPELLQGTVIRFTSRIRRPTNFKNPGAFDYQRYLAFKKISGLAYARADRLTVLSRPDPLTSASIVETARNRLAAQIDKSASPLPAGILKALIIGQKDQLPTTAREVFNRVGAGHLLAISGLHIGIIATIFFMGLTRLLALIPALTWRGLVRKVAAGPTLAVVTGYGLLAGMAPSTQRAVIMVAIFLMAFVVEKRPALLNSLALAALVILAVQPPALFSVSFQFSFVAVFFILCGMATVTHRLDRIRCRPARQMLSFVLVSLFAILGTAPLTMFYFNQTSLVGLAANCFMIPLIGFTAVPLGLTGAAAYLFSPGLSLLCFQAAGVVVEGAFFLARHMAAHPLAAIQTITPGRLEIICYYLLLWSLLKIFRPANGSSFFSAGNKGSPGSGRHHRLILAMALTALVVLSADIGYWIHRRWLHEDLRVTVLDVGQGNAALLEIPGGECVLIDGGGFAGGSDFNVGKMIVARFLWRLKIATVETLILTHPDTDHLDGLRYIAEHFHVKTVWSNGESLDTDSFRDFMEIVQRRKIDLPPLEKHTDTRRINKVSFDFLYPPPDFMDKKKLQPWRNTNNNSLVTRVSYGRISFLFPGDIMKQGEYNLVGRAGDKLASTVLMAPHHGSKTSSTNLFLNHVQPRQVVISAGRHNHYGYPHPAVLDRYADLGATVHCTGRDGAVIMKTRGTDLRVFTPLAGTAADD